MVLAGGQHSLQQKDFEVGEHVGTLAAHHLHQLGRQLEGRCFKPKITRRRGQHEAKVDVYDVTLVVKKNVSVVSVAERYKQDSVTSFTQDCH